MSNEIYTTAIVAGVGLVIATASALIGAAVIIFGVFFINMHKILK